MTSDGFRCGSIISLMRPFRFTHRRQRHWCRRAKSDGSAVPKLKGVRGVRVTWWAKTYSLFLYVYLFVWLTMFMSAAGYFLIGYWNIAPLIGVNWSMNQFMSIINVCLWLCFVLVPMFVVNIGLFLLGLHRFAKRVIAHRCHLCPRCGYSLQSRTDDAQPCPECGQRISRREAVRLWARFCVR